MPETARDRHRAETRAAQAEGQAREYFDELAGKFGRSYVPGRSWQALAHTLISLLPPLTVADLGAGEGTLSQLLAKTARKVIAIDNSPKMVEFGSDLAARAWLREPRIPSRRHRRSADHERLGRSRYPQPGAAPRHPSGARHRRRATHPEERRSDRHPRSSRAIASSGRASSTPITGSASAKWNCTSCWRIKASTKSKSPWSHEKKKAPISKRSLLPG